MLNNYKNTLPGIHYENNNFYIFNQVTNKCEVSNINSKPKRPCSRISKCILPDNKVHPTDDKSNTIKLNIKLDITYL